MAVRKSPERITVYVNTKKECRIFFDGAFKGEYPTEEDAHQAIRELLRQQKEEYYNEKYRGDKSKGVDLS